MYNTHHSCKIEILLVLNKLHAERRHNLRGMQAV